MNNKQSTHPRRLGVSCIARTAFLTALLTIPAMARADDRPPDMSPGTQPAPNDSTVFRPDPTYQDKPYSADQQIDIYGGKHAVDEPRPALELGVPLYEEGPVSGGFNLIGGKDLVNPAFSVFGDWRTAIAYNDNGHHKEVGQLATTANFEVDLQLTATERIHALFRPFEQRGFMNKQFFGPDNNGKFNGVDNFNVRDVFFEGDAGAIFSSLTNSYQSWDLPFSVGLVPMFFQNGVWANDAIAGGAFAIPALNSPMLGIANMDLSFFAGFDKVSTPAIKDKNGNLAEDDVKVYGAAAFIEANEGYWEAGFGHVDGTGKFGDAREFGDLSYNSATVAFTRRYFGLLSNSIRGVWSFGQDPGPDKAKTADGFIVLLENSLITKQELTLVPYFNVFAGFKRPQALIRNGDAGGILFNTGIGFQTDGLTGFPKLDDSGQDAFGGALGVEYLFNLDQQIVAELSTVQTFHGDSDPGRAAKGQQFGLELRYEIPLTNDLIWRCDGMIARRVNDNNIAGVRTELRLKF